MVEGHDVYTRSGDNLETRINITLFEALLGFSVNLTHLDNHTAEVCVCARVRPMRGFSWRVRVCLSTARVRCDGR